MSALTCPLCTTDFTEGDRHLYKHLRYKRFACGTHDCEKKFYTQKEQSEHCSAESHQRSFMVTTNPYTDMMIEAIVRDARRLVTEDMETVLKGQFGADEQQESARMTFSSRSIINPPSISRRSYIRMVCKRCGKKIHPNSKRGHVEDNHTEDVPILKCPIGECVEVYARECDLREHMQTVHSEDMYHKKFDQFQKDRKIRNDAIKKFYADNLSNV